MIERMKRLVKDITENFYIYTAMLKLALEECPQYLLILTGYMIAIISLPFGAIIFPNQIITQIQMHASLEMLLRLAIAMSIFYIIFRNLQNFCIKNGETKGEYLMICLKMRLNQINMAIPMCKMDNAEFQNRKEIAAQISYNSNYFNGYYYSWIKAIAAVVQVILILFLARKLSVVIIVFLLCFFCCSLLAGNYANRKMHEVESEKAPLQKMMKYIEKVISDYHYGKMIRIHGIGNWLLEKSEKKRGEFCQKRGEELTWEYFGLYVSTVLGGVQETIVYLYLIWKVVNGDFSIGEYVMYLAAIHQFSVALDKLVKSISEGNRYSRFAKDLIQFLEEEEKRTISEKQIDFEDQVKIEFKDVSFRYSENTEWILRNLNFTIKKGEKITLVGDNGAGKTTLLALLLRLYQPTEGKILLNGVEIQEIDESKYHKLFAMVFQEYQTYAFTIKENVVLGKQEEHSDDLVENALSVTGFQTNKFDKGIYTYIGKQFRDEAIDLSGGEQQKLVMARAVYRNSHILILDEPTANLSPMAESQIYHDFYKIGKNKTVLFVSHRLSSSKFCDRILVLAQGKIVENGTHEELIAKEGIYCEMFRKQASYYVEEKDYV